MAHEPIGVSPLVSFFVADVKLLIASAAGYYHGVVVAHELLFELGPNRLYVFVIHLIYFVVLSLTH